MALRQWGLIVSKRPPLAVRCRARHCLRKDAGGVCVPGARGSRGAMQWSGSYEWVCVCVCAFGRGGGGAGGSGARRSETLPLHTFMSENLSVTGVPHVMFRLWGDHSQNACVFCKLEPHHYFELLAMKMFGSKIHKKFYKHICQWKKRKSFKYNLNIISTVVNVPVVIKVLSIFFFLSPTAAQSFLSFKEITAKESGSGIAWAI